MPVHINEIIADVEVTPPGQAGPAASADEPVTAAQLEALQRRLQQQAERLAAWGRDD